MLFGQPQPEQEEQQSGPVRIHVPFVQQESGLGDLIKRITGALGVSPCGGCQRRAEALNERVVVAPWDE